MNVWLFQSCQVHIHNPHKEMIESLNYFRVPTPSKTKSLMCLMHADPLVFRERRELHKLRDHPQKAKILPPFLLSKHELVEEEGHIKLADEHLLPSFIANMRMHHCIRNDLRYGAFLLIWISSEWLLLKSFWRQRACWHCLLWVFRHSVI